MKLDQVYNYLHHHSKDIYDFKSPLDKDNIEADYDGKLVLKVNNKDWQITNTAYQQLCERLGIPFRFINNQDIDLQILLLNEMLRRVLSKEATFRTKDNHIRAILSDRYTSFDHIQTIDVLYNSIKEDHEVDFDMDKYGDYMSIRLILFQNERKEKDSIYRTGIHLMNSETGLGSIAVNGFIHRLVCENGMIADDGECLRKIHVGLDVNEMKARITATLDRAIDVSGELLDKFLEAKKVTVESPFRVLENIGKENNLTKTFIDKCKSELGSIEPKHVTKFELVNAITHQAKWLAESEKSKVQALAGRIVENKIAA